MFPNFTRWHLLENSFHTLFLVYKQCCCFGKIIKKKSSLFVYKACCCFGIKNHILFLKPVMTEIQENHCDCAPLSQSSNTHAKPRRTLLEMSFLWANDFQRLQGLAVLLKIPVCASNLANFIIILFFIWPRRILKFPWVQNSWLKGLGIWRA